MKIQNNSNSLKISLVGLHGSDWIEKQRFAGQVHSEIMQLLEKLIAEKTNLSLLEMDDVIKNEILKKECTPTFLMYKGFPGACCISVNHTVVHGIGTNIKLQDGDVVTFDFGVTYKGAICDAAKTFIFGTPKTKDHVNMISAVEECLYNAIKTIKPGLNLGIIGNAIYKTAQKFGFNVINSLGGHSLSWNNPHAYLFVPNKAEPNEGIHIQPNLTLAIEPIIGPGDTATALQNDGWSINTKEIFAHIEHTIFIHDNMVEIMTWRPSEKDKISREIKF